MARWADRSAWRHVEKLMPFLHLPVQAGIDRILKAMNRSHDVASYLKLIERVRAVRPDIAISGDYIVGFPGETDADFQATLDTVRAIDHAQAFSFKYSPASGHPGRDDGRSGRRRGDGRAAAGAAGAAQRTATGLQPGDDRQACEVLIERNGKFAGQMLGKSPWLQSVIVENGPAIGELVTVDIVAAGPNSMTGMVVAERAAA
jgi:tRNA-2-methylthio-N6-dimethylallyladenosine synthase